MTQAAKDRDGQTADKKVCIDPRLELALQKMKFPSLSWLARTPETALKGIRELVANIVTDMTTSDEEIPEPIACRTFSGKFMVRVPPEVHRKLAIQAAEAGVSLNRITSSKLS